MSLVLSICCLQTFLLVMPLLNLKIMGDVSYPQQDRQCVSNIPEQRAGMGRTGLRDGVPHNGLRAERVFQTKYCAVQRLTAEEPSAGTAKWCGCN